VFDRRTALLSAGLCAIHPMLIWYTARIWIETTHTLLVSTVALTLVLLFEKPDTSRAVQCGVAFGLALLTKSVLLLFPFVAATLVMRRRRSHTHAAALLIASTAVIVTPWTLRNLIGSGMFIPIHTSAGLNMVQGDALAEHWSAAPFSTVGLWKYGKAQMDSLLKPTSFSPEDPEGDRFLLEKSLARNVLHPVAALKRIVMNAITFWFLSETATKSTVLAVLQLPLLIGLMAASCRFRKRTAARPLIALVWYFWIVHMFLVGWARYSAPIIPLCAILSAGLFQGLTIKREQSPGQVP
jgi:hypothetical protein